MEDALLDICPICLKGPGVPLKHSWLSSALGRGRRFTCSACQAELEYVYEHPLYGEVYRYRSIPSGYRQPEWDRMRTEFNLRQLQQLAETNAIDRRRAVEADIRRSLRPRTLGSFIGQDAIKNSLLVSITAAERRRSPLGHILLCGEEVSGRTTLAGVIAHEMGASLAVSHASKSHSVDDVLAPSSKIPTRRNGSAILLIESINELTLRVQEELCAPLDSWATHRPQHSGYPAASSTHIRKVLTVIASAHRSSELSPRLLRRFEHIYTFKPYTVLDTALLLERWAEAFGLEFEDEALAHLADLSAGPTIQRAQLLFDRARDVAAVTGDTVIKLGAVCWAHSDLASSHAAMVSAERAGLRQLTWQGFEDRVAEAFRRLGYRNVSLTARTGDQGKDITMEWADPLRGNRRIYVECKHWQANRVGRREVQILHSAVVASPHADEGILVTTGRFTDSAVEYVERAGIIQLVDGDRLRELMEKAGMH